MKRTQKKLVVVAMVTLSVFFGCVVTSFATVCSNASIQNVGAKANSNAVFIKETTTQCDGIPDAGLWVVLDPANADAMLATALTAMSLGKNVIVVNASGPFVNQGTIIEIYVSK